MAHTQQKPSDRELPQAPSAADTNASKSMKNLERPSRSVILISGAGTPVGTSLALAFGSNSNYQLALLDSNQESLSRVVSLIQHKRQLEQLAKSQQATSFTSQECVRPLELLIDLANSTDERDAERAIKSTLDHFGKLDILVNLGCSIVGDQAPKGTNLEPSKTDDGNGARERDLQICCSYCISNYHKIMNSQVNAIVYLCLASFEPLRASQGSIINITQSNGNLSPNGTIKNGAQRSGQLNGESANLIDGQRFTFASCTAKAALTTFSKCLAHDFAPFVRVNCISLGPIASGIIYDMGLTTKNVKEIDPNVSYKKREDANNNNNIAKTDKHCAILKMSNTAAVNLEKNNNSGAGDCELAKLSLQANQAAAAAATFTATTTNVAVEQNASSGSLCDGASCKATSNELAKMIIYLSSRERGAYITGSRVLLGGSQI